VSRIGALSIRTRRGCDAASAGGSPAWGIFTWTPQELPEEGVVLVTVSHGRPRMRQKPNRDHRVRPDRDIPQVRADLPDGRLVRAAMPVRPRRGRGEVGQTLPLICLFMVTLVGVAGGGGDIW